MSISKIGGSVFRIAGASIGIGLLAHTAKNISRITKRPYRIKRKKYKFKW